MPKRSEQIAPLVRGYCPSSYSPMASQKGWIIRVRPPFEGLDVQQGRFICSVAQKYCDGFIQLTNRGNIQLRVASKDNINAILVKAIQLKLIHPQEDVEKRLNIVTNPQASYDSYYHPETLLCAEQLRQAIMDAPQLSGLSAKFGFVVDGYLDLASNALLGDVTIRYLPCEKRWMVQSGDFRTFDISRDEAVSDAIALATVFSQKPRGTLRPLRDPGEMKELFEDAGIPYQHASYPFSFKKAYLAQPLGNIARDIFAYHVSFGFVSSEAFQACFDNLKNSLHSRIIITPWQGFIMYGSREGIRDKELITSREDHLFRTFACPGQGYCSQALGETYGFARKLARYFPKLELLHVSGCAKGCAWPHKAEETFVAQSDGYGYISDGTAKDEPMRSFGKNTSIPVIVDAVKAKG